MAPACHMLARSLACAAIVLLVSFAPLAHGAGSAAEDRSLQSIDANNFQRTVVESKDVWCLEFFSPRCGTCKAFSPLFERLAAKHGHVRFGTVNIDDAAGMKLATDSGALEEGVPSVRVYKRVGDARGALVWSGDDAPAMSELEAAFAGIVPTGRRVARLRKV